MIYNATHPMIYNATHDPTGEEEAMMNELFAQFPAMETLLQDEEKPLLSPVLEFIASRSYHIGYEHGQKDCGAYIAELEAIIAKNKPEEPCPECGGKGFTIGFIGNAKKRFTCSTCSTFKSGTGERA